MVSIFHAFESFSEQRATDSASRLTSDLCINLARFSQYEVKSAPIGSGLTTLTVKHKARDFAWIAIASLVTSLYELRQAFSHLLKAQPPSWPNKSGGLISYIQSDNVASLLSEWQREIEHQADVSTVTKACTRRPNLNFYSDHTHRVTGLPFEVWHSSVLLPRLSQGPQDFASSHLEATAKTPVESGQKRRSHVVMLIHGIRTQAEWQNRVAAILESDPSIRVVPTRFGFLDVLRFLIPFEIVRRGPVTRITKLIRDELSRKPEKLSIIAHSFGTFIVSQILEEESDIELHRVILCGSIIADNFNWARHKGQFGIRDTLDWQIINDCGMRDIWPVFAQSVTWGYGSSGRFGFGHGRVKDRFHAVGHSDFFSAEFVREYWLTFISQGQIAEGMLERPTTPLWVSLMTVVKLKYFLLVLTGLLVWWFATESTQSKPDPPLTIPLNFPSIDDVQRKIFDAPVPLEPTSDKLKPAPTANKVNDKKPLEVKRNLPTSIDSVKRIDEAISPKFEPQVDGHAALILEKLAKEASRLEAVTLNILPVSVAPGGNTVVALQIVIRKAFPALQLNIGAIDGLAKGNGVNTPKFVEFANSLNLATAFEGKFERPSLEGVLNAGGSGHGYNIVLVGVEGSALPMASEAINFAYFPVKISPNTPPGTVIPLTVQYMLRGVQNDPNVSLAVGKIVVSP